MLEQKDTTEIKALNGNRGNAAYWKPLYLAVRISRNCKIRKQLLIKILFLVNESTINNIFCVMFFKNIVHDQGVE